MDRSDHQERIERNRSQEVVRQSSELRQVAQAVPAMESLTGQPHWDTFLSLLAGMIEERERHYDGLRESFLDPEMMEHTQLMQLKVESLQVRQTIHTLREVSELPKVLMEEGRRAQKLLKRYVPNAG